MLKNVHASETTGLIAEARRIAGIMVQNESRGPGDFDNAMRRLDTRYPGLYWLLFALRYRDPTDILMSNWLLLTRAYEAECERLSARAAHELEVARRLKEALEPRSPQP